MWPLSLQNWKSGFRCYACRWAVWVRGLKGRCPILYLFFMDNFTKSYFFLYFFSVYLLLFCLVLSTWLKGEMLLQHNPVLRDYYKMFRCWACISLVKQGLDVGMTKGNLPCFVGTLTASHKCNWSCSGRLNVLVCTWKRRLASCKLQVTAEALFEGIASCSGCLPPRES